MDNKVTEELEAIKTELGRLYRMVNNLIEVTTQQTVSTSTSSSTDWHVLDHGSGSKIGPLDEAEAVDVARELLGRRSGVQVTVARLDDQGMVREISGADLG